MKPRSTAQRVARTLALIVDLIAAAALCLTAYAGRISPLQHGGIWGVLPLGFPLCLAAVVLLALLQLLWHRRGAVVLGVALLACAGPIAAFSPIHFGTVKAEGATDSFTLMSYNIHNFLAPGISANTDTVSNATLDYILATGADIVCLQEATDIARPRKGHITPAQAAAFNDVYPEIYVNGELAVLSKFPLEPIHLDDTRKNFPGGNISCYRVTLPSGRRFTLFNVHMASMHLNDDDRRLFVGITDLQRQGLSDIKGQLIDKLAASAVERAREAQQLTRYLRLYGGPDVLLTGDFNDVPGCYTLDVLADCGLHSAYAARGKGPTATFNQSRLYFRIDHTLYRGVLRPLDIYRGRQTLSDHYPLISTWAVCP